MSPSGSELFQTGGERDFEILYAQGPLLSRREWDDPKVPNYESLAIYNGEIAKNGAPRGVMARTSAIVRSEFGKGKVICFSPHPESTKGKEKLIGYAIEWLANSD